MLEDPKPVFWSPKHSISFAHGSCLCMGIGLVLWGLAPLLIERLVTGKAPHASLLATNGVIFAMGAAFVTFHAYIRAERIWAAWASFALSSLIGGASVAIVISTAGQSASLLMLLLPAQTAIASWLAIGALMQAQAAAQREAHPSSGARKVAPPHTAH